MRKPNRALRVLGAAGLIIGLLAAMIAPVSAQREVPGEPGKDSDLISGDADFIDIDNTIYYPWVANDDPTLGLGPADTMISIQNLSDRDAQIFLYVGDGGGGFSFADSAYLARYASKTFFPEDLGIGSGTGAPVKAVSYHIVEDYLDGDISGVESLTVFYTVDEDTGDFIVDEDAPPVCLLMSEVEPPSSIPPEFANISVPDEVPGSFVAAVDIPDYSYLTWRQGTNALGATIWTQVEITDGPYTAGEIVEVDNYFPYDNWVQVNAILDAVNLGDDWSVNPFGGIDPGGNCNARVVSGTLYAPVAIAGVAKMAVDGEALPFTTEFDTAVSGYNAFNGWEVFRFDEWYLPIVQTNCGPGGCWDSTIRVANVGARNNAVTVRFFPADDGSGSLNEGFQLQRRVHGGATWNISLSDYVPEGWVGSAHIYSDGATFAMVDRFKVGYNMWITNTGSSGDYENRAQVASGGTGFNYVLFAPHVLTDYFGWNTGINVANLDSENHNNVSIQYFNLFGNATQGLTRRLAPHGMTYFYDPSIAPQNDSEQDVETDANANIVGSALIWSDYPVAAVVDATKYPESDPSGRADLYQATSYSATQNVFTWQAVPYVSKGSPIDGSGATSGINIMNPNAQAVTANVYYVNENGFNAQNFGVSSVTVPGYANGFVYTLWQKNLPNGFYGAAQVISSGPVAAVSANVDYGVDGDGSVMYNAFNPCGFFRTTQGDEETADDLDRLNAECSYGDAFDITGGSVTKTFVDGNGNPVQGVEFEILGLNPAFPYQRDGFSGPDGSVMFTNVPVGEYELNVRDVPDIYELPDNPADAFTITQGADLQITNVLEWAQGFMKTVCVADYDFIDEEDEVPVILDECSDINLSGVNVIVFENIGQTALGSQVAGEIVFEGVTGPGGSVGASLPVGNYILCMFDLDGVALTTNTGEEVVPDLPDDFYATGQCAQSVFGEEFELYGDLFTVVSQEVTELVNPVVLAEGVLNIFAGAGEVCITDADDDDASQWCEPAWNGIASFDGARPGVRYSIDSDVGAATFSDSVWIDTDNEDLFQYNPTVDLVQDGWMDDSIVPDPSFEIPQGELDMTIQVADEG